MFRGSRRRGGEGIALVLLLSELMRNWEYLPIVTLSTIVGQILISLRLLATYLPWGQDDSVCVSLYKVLRQGDYGKIIISQIEHADDWHLYYNMISFMSKSKSLEEKLGTVKYILLLILFIICTGLTYLGLNYALFEFTNDDTYLYRCAVGFSGVIFALKVLTTHYWPNDQARTFYLMGLPLFSTGSISSKYAVWVELGLISLISPNASFVGHLAGILVGLAYTNGPLKLVLDIVYDIIAPLLGLIGYTPRQRFYQSSYTTGTESTGSSRAQSASNAQRRYNPSSPEMTEDEQIRRATEESLRDFEQQGSRNRHYGFEAFQSPNSHSDHQPSAPNERTSQKHPTPLTQEELRQQRLRRFT